MASEEEVMDVDDDGLEVAGAAGSMRSSSIPENSLLPTVGGLGRD